jgi:murein DD-endopeptidase MepM/ murein hydrolase activator NlpD
MLVMVRRWKAWLVVLALLAVGGGTLLWRQRQPGVTVTLDPAVTALGHPKRTVTLVLHATAGKLASLEAQVVQGGVAHTVLTEDLSAAATSEARRPLTLEADAIGLKEGPAELLIFARDSLWRPRPDRGPRLVQRLTVDLTPPTLELRAATGYLKHAGAGVAVYRTTGAARSGVQVGTTFFPGVAGLAADPAIFVAFFAIPYDGAAVPPSAVAEDEAGNQRVLGIPVTFLPARFPKDTIRLTEAFLRRKVPELAPQTPGTAPLDQLVTAFLQVNREGRKEAEAKIRAITQAETAAKPLWTGPFHQQPNTKVFANFPEERTYEVEGRTVDTAWHLGIDLASSKRTPVEASNAGRVVFTGANGIYGNMIVLDHGLGLFTLYAHLSEIGVKVGQEVKVREPLGRSGETGLAGGDHIHFALLVRGVYASPLEWWDPHWLRDRVAKPLADAGVNLPGITDGALTPAATPAAQVPVRRAASRPRHR